MTDTSLAPEFSEDLVRLAESTPSGFLVALWLDGETAGKLAVSGGEPAESFHITLAYVPKADEIDELTQARVVAAVYDEVKYTSGPEGTIAGFGRFKASDTSDGKDVFYLTPDLPRLFDLRQRIICCLENHGLWPSTAHGYTPHITLSYIDAEAETPDYTIPELELKFAGVTIVSGTRRTDIPFWVPEYEAPISMSETAEDVAPDALLGSHPARPMYFGSFDKEWIPFLPKPGTYNHEVFGVMDLTSSAYDKILDNFNNYVYKQDLPIRATHTPAEAGAVGWIKPGGMRLADDGSLEVKPDWNKLGQGLVDDDRFRYVSAEFCRKWVDPVTQEEHDNVAVGLALVTRPHFKTDVLNPLSASEALAFSEVIQEESAEAETPVETQEGEDVDPVVNEVHTDVKEVPVVETPPTAVPAVATPPAAQDVTLSDLTQVVITAEQRNKERLAFSDLQTRVELAERRASTAEARLGDIERERRVEKFTAEVIGRSAANGEAWFGDAKANVEQLVSLAEKFGDDSPEVSYTITQKRNEAKAIRSTGIFDPIALGAQENGNSAAAQIMHLAEQYRRADPTLSQEKAISKAYDEHPDLYMASLKK